MGAKNGGKGVPPPVIGDKLMDILPAQLMKDMEAAGHWKDEYKTVTRGDLMRIGGWMAPMPGTTPTKYDPSISATMLGLSAEDIKHIAVVLEKYNMLTYGHSVYVCCTCA